MKVTVWHNGYEGTACEIVAQMAQRDHETADPWKYMRAVDRRIMLGRPTYPYRIWKANNEDDCRKFLERLEWFGLLTIDQS